MKKILRIVTAAILLLLFHFISVEGTPRLLLYLIPYLIVGYDVLADAVHGISEREPFDEELLMTVATLGALVLGFSGGGDYTEAVAVMLLYQLGEWFQDFAVDNSKRSIGHLLEMKASVVHLQGADGRLQDLPPEEVAAGSILLIRPGERVPLDGILAEGRARLDTRALTGESRPRTVEAGGNVLSGCINAGDAIRIKTVGTFENSTVARILALVREAAEKKSRSEKFITRFARVYTPAVVFSALGLALLPPLIRSLVIGKAALWGTWIYRALIFLIISCPCALVISVPLSFFAALGGASRSGILIKGSNYLEMLANTGVVIFDKTGTLTKGVFQVVAVHPEEIGEEELLHLAAHAERYSNHPIAQSLKNAYPGESDACRVEDVRELPGRGVRVAINGEVYYVGNRRLMEEAGATVSACDCVGTIVHVARGSLYLGHILIADVEKPTAAKSVRALRDLGVEDIYMFTGDEEAIAAKTARDLAMSGEYSRMLPQDKVHRLEELKNALPKGKRLAFVGDGINDAPVIMRSDVGIAMGGFGQDAAIEAADVVLMEDDPAQVADAVRHARRCMRIVHENIVFAIGTKGVVLILGALGLAGMWAAVFADVGVMVLAVLNSLRAMRHA